MIKFRTAIFFLLITVALFIADLAFGSVHVPLHDVWAALTGGEVSESKYKVLVQSSRLPRAITALLAGAALGTSGLLMQTLFRNPVAGPYILGVSSGASLGVALALLGGAGSWLAIAGASVRVLAAAAGALASLLVILLAARRIRDAATLLIMGLMVAAFTSAFTGILQYFAGADALRDFIYWTFGSLDHTHWEELQILGAVVLFGLFCSLLLSRPLDLMLLGEDSAKTMGLDTQQTRTIIILLTALLAGGVTAYCGPIAFVGIAVPHLVRIFQKSTKHAITLPLTMIAGGALMLFCDLLSRMPWTGMSLPINSVTSIIGAPAVIVVLWRYRRLGNYFSN